MTIRQIAEAFSNGNFERVYEYLLEEIEWEVIGENKFIGKDAVVKNCEQTAGYFKTVTTVFKTLNVMTDDNKIVINGTGEFIKENKRVAFISSCDVYEFNENQQLVRITSYCIPEKIV